MEVFILSFLWSDWLRALNCPILGLIYCCYCRMIKRISWATAASQVLRFCCRNSWRGNRCRKRWPSSYEKGIAPHEFFLSQVQNPTSCFLVSVLSLWITVLHKTEKCTLKKSGCIMVVMSNNETLYFLLRIKIEEEYAKNLSKLSQFPLAGQEEGSATFVPKVSLSKKCCYLLKLRRLNYVLFFSL